MEETSLSLLDRLSTGGDRDSWNRLHALYSPLLMQWLKRFDVQDADAEDLIQDVFTVMVKELPEFQHNQRVGAFRNWMRQILVFQLRNFWRSRKYRPNTPANSDIWEQLNQLADDVSDISRVWDAEHDRYVLAQLIALVQPRFAEKTWEAFRRQIFEGQSPGAVATDLDMPLNSVYVARSRVLAALRRDSAGIIDAL